MKEIAIIYDFDGTLAKGNIPEHGLLHVAPADYTDGSQLDIVIKGVLDRMINEK